MKMDQILLSIDFDSWSELSGSMMTDRKLVQKSKSHMQMQSVVWQWHLYYIIYVWLIEKCEEDQLQFHPHFVSKHIISMVFPK